MIFIDRPPNPLEAQLLFWTLFFIASIIFFFFFRFWFFFRNPERKIAEGNNIVSPADGYVIYIKEIKDNEVPISIKKGQKITLNELVDDDDAYTLVIGIFMTPFSVHYNRYPFSGKVEKIHYRSKPQNFVMTRCFLNMVFGFKPYERDCLFMLENERNTTVIKSDDVDCAVVQIADKWVNKIKNNCKTGDFVIKGERLGLIKMGSQCDIYLKIKRNYEIKVKERDYVKAGSKVLIELL